MDQYDGKIGTATHLLSHYLRTVWEEAGLRWDSDNDSEVRQLVEAIASTTDERINELEEKVKELTKQLETLDDRFDSLHRMVYLGEAL